MSDENWAPTRLRILPGVSDEVATQVTATDANGDAIWSVDGPDGGGGPCVLLYGEAGLLEIAIDPNGGARIVWQPTPTATDGQGGDVDGR